MSPNYPRTYEAPVKTRNSSTFPDNNGFITCQWEIIVPKGKGIQLKFGDFDMNAEADICDKGQVDIFTGTGKTKSFLGEFGGFQTVFVYFFYVILFYFKISRFTFVWTYSILLSDCT